MDMFDEAVLTAFLKKQKKLFPENVAETQEEASFFLEDVCAVVCNDEEETLEYLKENLDVTGMTDEQILACEEVFSVGDGRYLIVEG